MHFLSQEKYDIKMGVDKLDILVQNIIFCPISKTLSTTTFNTFKKVSDEVIKPMLKGRVEAKVF